MADNTTLRSHRSNDLHRRNAGPADAQGLPPDPLAELARLIGQNDPFADNQRSDASGAPARPQNSQNSSHAAPPPGDWRRHIEKPVFAPEPDEPPMRVPVPPESYQPSHDAPPMADHARAYRADRDPYRADRDPYRMPQQPETDSRYAEMAPGHPDDSAYHAVPEQGGDHPAVDPAYHHATALDAQTEAAYDDPPRRKRGNGLATVAMLVGCALLGTVGAYGYRVYAKPAGAKQAPVITADRSPSKVVPAAPEQKASRSQERIATQGGAERLVSREEQPVALPQTAAISPPRVVFPAPVQTTQSAVVTTTPPPAPTASPSSTSSLPPAGNSKSAAANPAPGNSAEPKRIRTVTIRADKGDNGDTTRSTVAPPPSSPPRAAAPQTRPASPSAKAPAARNDEPLSLDPSAQRAQAREPVREAARSPQRSPVPLTTPRDDDEPPASRTATAPNTGASSGSYIVQVSSQRSEADARASYRGLQSKYSQLRARQAIIRKADLGSKGVYYRAMVGPFGSAGEADQFCNGLKQSGGQCIILRN